MLTSPELQDVLVHHVLPLCSLGSLGQLACSCRTLRDTLYAQVHLFQAGATAILPAMHPPLEHASLADVQIRLQRRAGAVRNLLAGQVAASSTQIQGNWYSDCAASFSPNSTRVAVQGVHHLTVIHAATGDQACRFVWRELAEALDIEQETGCVPEPVLVWGPTDIHLVACLPINEQQLLFLHLDAGSGEVEETACLDISAHVAAGQSTSKPKASFSRHGQLVAVVTARDRAASHVLVVDPATAAVLVSSPLTGGGRHSIWSGDGRLLASCGYLIDVPARAACPLASDGAARGMEFSRSGRLLAFTSGSNNAVFVDVGSACVWRVLERYIFLAFSGREERVLVNLCCEPGYCRVWDLKLWQSLVQLPISAPLPHPWLFGDRFLLGHLHEQTSMQRTGRVPATARLFMLAVWDAYTGDKVAFLPRQEGPIRWPFARSPDDCSLCTVPGGATSKLHIFRLV